MIPFFLVFQFLPNLSHLSDGYSCLNLTFIISTSESRNKHFLNFSLVQ